MTALALDDGTTTIALAGDWHGQTSGVWQTLQRLSEAGVTRVYHVGDFAIWPDKSGTKFLNEINHHAEELGTLIAVTPGNHEDWAYLLSAFSAADGGPALIRSNIHAFPRGFRWSHAGRTFVSFGGAASIDFEYRRNRRDWWAEEMPTSTEVEHVIAGGPAEIMIAHDSPIAGTPVVEQIRASNPQGWSSVALEYARGSAQTITEVWDAVQPDVLVHGHFHVRDAVALPTGQRIISLADGEAAGNVILLDLSDMRTTWLEDLDA